MPLEQLRQFVALKNSTPSHDTLAPAEVLDWADATATIDAMGCQKAIAQALQDKSAD